MSQATSIGPVVIVGAGPVGMTAALLLANLGVETLLLERHPRLYPLPRAVHIDDEAFRILQRAGVAEQFAGVSRPLSGLRLVDGDLRPLAEFRRDRSLGDHGYPQANIFDQPDLEVLLSDQVQLRPEITMQRGVELVGLRSEHPGEASPIILTVHHLDADETNTIWAPAVLGCDGANSTVRDLIGAGLITLGREDRWLVVDIRSSCSIDAWAGVQQVCDPDRAATFMQIGPGRYRWEFRLAPYEEATDLTQPDALIALLAPWLEDVGVPDLSILRSSEYVFRAQISDRWSRGRVFLLGDAAHLTPPFIGQGLGLGLRDAANLSWKIASVLRCGADERLLDSYSEERVPHARQLIRMAVVLGHAMTGDQSTLIWIRRAVLATLRRAPWATKHLADTAAPSLRAGTLIRRRRLNAALRPHRNRVGKMIPQPWLNVAGQRLRLDHIIGHTYGIITDRPADDDLLALAQRLPATLLIIRADSSGTPSLGAARFVLHCRDDDRVLKSWMRSAGATAVLVRPDRVVLAVARRTVGYGAELCRAASSNGPSSSQLNSS